MNLYGAYPPWYVVVNRHRSVGEIWPWSVHRSLAKAEAEQAEQKAPPVSRYDRQHYVVEILPASYNLSKFARKNLDTGIRDKIRHERDRWWTVEEVQAFIKDGRGGEFAALQYCDARVKLELMQGAGYGWHPKDGDPIYECQRRPCCSAEIRYAEMGRRATEAAEAAIEDKEKDDGNTE